ncbi:hypothetical protein SAMN05661012_00952 [Chitinophaga sancti]|uniref:Uncharacterized protein n=1 Tax=Chitinophaga sancti TaxID=1004 RepID=A0A1K1MW59_9BACT|nr:hypothetical protein SAMN05661012_00952 [Chitinophaga sancti]
MMLSYEHKSEPQFGRNSELPARYCYNISCSPATQELHTNLYDRAFRTKYGAFLTRKYVSADRYRNVKVCLPNFKLILRDNFRSLSAGNFPLIK